MGGVAPVKNFGFEPRKQESGGLAPDVFLGSPAGLEHGKPVVFGADSNRGLRLNHDLQPEIVTIGENGITEADVMVWDEADASPARAMALAAMSESDFPVPLGILRSTTRPAFEKEVNAQVQTAQQNRGDQKLQDLLNGPDRYTI